MSSAAPQQTPNPPAGSLGSAPPKKRVALWDNSRFVLLVLVVIGHTISTIRTDTALGYGTYIFVYAFHMPALIMLSGYFSKPDVNVKAVRSTVQLVALWGLWEGIWALIRFFFNDRPLPSTFLVSPAWSLWFIVSLVTMRIVLPYIARFRHPLLVSIGLALGAGLLPAIGTEFSASRTLCLLPFFVAGWLAKRDGWLTHHWFLEPVRRTQAAAWGVLGLGIATVAVLAQFRTSWRADTWLVLRDDYFTLFDKAPLGEFAPNAFWSIALSGIALRLLLILVAAALTLALLLVVPRGAGAATVWGTRTLYIYLLHGLIVTGMRDTGVIDWFGNFGSLGVVMLIVIGVIMTIVLSMKWVAKVFRPIIEPQVDRWTVRD